MAFRRKRFTTRRRRARWDMQTFRECERDMPLCLTGDCGDFPCSQPQIFADLLSGPVASTDSPMLPGASRAMMYGGGYLKYRYDLAIMNSTNMPCSFNLKVVTAVIVLPLLEDDLTPAYLPNLAIARSQLSVVHSTQSDTDENILYWNDANLLAHNESCSGLQGNCLGSAGCGTETDTANVIMRSWRSIAAALYGRQEITTRIKVKRRLKEREGLFLTTQYVALTGTAGNSQIDWPIRRTVYHRYAVRVSR